MPIRVCLRSELSAEGGLEAGCDARGGSDGVALGRGGSERGAVAAVASERGVTGAIPSRVLERSGLAADLAAAGAGEEGRTAGGSGAAGYDGGAAAGGFDRVGASVAEGAGAPARGTRAGAGISSAPHSESMSSVGGAMEGRGGRELSDRLSVIALFRLIGGSQPTNWALSKAFSCPAAQIKLRCIFASKNGIAATHDGALRKRQSLRGRGHTLRNSGQLPPDSLCLSKSPSVPKPPSALSF